jgi:hypothetical protein
VAEAAEWLPDLDMPINYLDESRVLTDWDKINSYVHKAEMNKRSVLARDTIKQYTGLAELDKQDKRKVKKSEWITKGQAEYWDLTRLGCPPDSLGKNVSAVSPDALPPMLPHDWKPSFSEHGYIHNYSAAINPCLQPHLRALHGTFVEPASLSTTQDLIPLFSGSKLPMNNDILLPGAMYLSELAMYSGGGGMGPHWSKKKDRLIWRGTATGGQNRKENWSHFQRHRLVEMLNGTTVSHVEHNNVRAMSFEMPPLELYDFPRRRQGTIGEWLEGFADVGFIDLLCTPSDDKSMLNKLFSDNCDYLTSYFHQVDSLPMSKQFENKFIPDTDGNSFSGRYRALLLSTSLPLKATIYTEWHDDRLQPWLHFVPLDNTFQDLYGVLDFFTRDSKGDEAAQTIAESGKNWSEKVLRREDMLLYTWRLLLEFARVCDKHRDRLGFVDDLLDGNDRIQL